MKNQLRVVSSVKQSQEILSDLTNPNRDVPICLVSTIFNSERTDFDLEELSLEIGTVAKIVLIRTGEATADLSKNLSPGLGVFGGAARVYPPGFKVNTTQYLPLIYPDGGGSKRLAEQVWAHADISSLKKSQLRDTEDVEATVKQVIPSNSQSRVFVEIDGGELATIREELSFPNTPLEWVFKPGDRVFGSHNSNLKVFTPNLRFLTTQDLLNDYKLGQIIPVYVSEVDRMVAKCVPYPGIQIDIHIAEISGNSLDKISDFLDAGEVVGMRLYSKPDNSLGLRMDDIDDHEVCVAAVPVFETGESWITEGRNFQIQPSIPVLPSLTKTNISQYIEEKPFTPLPGPGIVKGLVTKSTDVEQKLKGRERSDFEYQIKYLKGVITSLVDEVDGLKSENAGLKSENTSLTNSLDSAKKAATSLRRKGQKVIGSKSSPRSRRDRFSSDDEWFHEELRRAWLSNYAPQDRRDNFPLDDSKFLFGPEFFRSLKESNCDEEDLRKVIRCILDIVTGREKSEARRDVHPLRDGLGPAAKDLIREDGAVALRAYVEEKTPAAKRLHFWAPPNGRIELMRVVSHNDYKI
jgi:hypothetical protein